MKVRSLTPYAPCGFAASGDHAEALEADARILVTTTGSPPTAAIVGWDVRTLRP